MTTGKKFAQAAAKVDRARTYDFDAAIALVKGAAFAKFDETVECAVRLGIDPKRSDQAVKGAVVLPHGLGTTERVAVFAKGEKEKEAQAAGADVVGAEDLAERITGGWMDFDRVVATPDLMGMVGKLGKILGPRGLMPNPKLGTVTNDVGRAVSEIKAGKLEFKSDKSGIVHARIGKVSFSQEHLVANLRIFMETILRLKPPSSKGRYLKSITVSSTMGPGVKIDSVWVTNLMR